MKLHVVKKNEDRRPPESIQHQLNAYLLAVGAAGAALLATPQTLRAEVVFTPTHITLTNGQLPLDLNNDGIADFVLADESQGGSCCLYTRKLGVVGEFVGSNQNGVEGIFVNAVPLGKGEVVGPNDLFLAANLKMASAFNDSNSFFYVSGLFANTKDRFLGFRFLLQGKMHYGWARFRVVSVGLEGSKPVISATLTGYAYETIPNHALVTGYEGKTSRGAVVPSLVPQMGEPTPRASLGILALGASGLSVWRRDDDAAGRSALTAVNR